MKQFGKTSLTLEGDPDTCVPLADEKDWDLGEGRTSLYSVRCPVCHEIRITEDYRDSCSECGARADLSHSWYYKGFWVADFGLVEVEIFYGTYNGVSVRFLRTWDWRIGFTLTKGELILRFLRPALVIKW